MSSAECLLCLQHEACPVVGRRQGDETLTLWGHVTEATAEGPRPQQCVFSALQDVPLRFSQLLPGPGARIPPLPPWVSVPTFPSPQKDPLLSRGPVPVTSAETLF